MKTEYNAADLNQTTEAASPREVAHECPTPVLGDDVCRPLTKKICKGCKLLFTLDAFYFNKTKKSWLSECKECNKARSSAWNKNNAERYKANCKKHLKLNPDLYKAYKSAEYIRNKDVYEASNRKYRQSDSGKAVRLASNRLRELAKISATPPWLTKEHKESMKIFYKNRPKGFHVDHIVPIKGKNVCGLHVPWNLQYLPAAENIKKRNKF